MKVSHEFHSRVVVEKIDNECLQYIRNYTFSPRFREPFEIHIGDKVVRPNQAPRYRGGDASTGTDEMIVRAFDVVHSAVHTGIIPRSQVKVNFLWANDEKLGSIRTRDYAGWSGAKFRVLVTTDPSIQCTRKTTLVASIKQKMKILGKCLLAFAIG